MSLDALRAVVTSAAQPTTETVESSQLSSLRGLLRGSGSVPPIEQRIEEGLSFEDRLAQRRVEERAARSAPRDMPVEDTPPVVQAATVRAPEPPVNPLKAKPMQPQQETAQPAPARDAPVISTWSWLPGALTPRNLHNLNIENIMLERTPNGTEARRMKDTMSR